MGLKKGQTNNRDGRPRGKPNRITSELRTVIKSVLDSELTPTKLRKTLAEMEPATRLNFLIKLMDFCLPRLRQTDLSIDIEKMSESELNIVIDHILNNKNHTNEHN